MSIEQIIKANPTAAAACAAGDYAAARAALVADTTTVRDSTGWKLDDLIDAVGTAGARTVVKSLKKAGATDELLEIVRDALATPLGVRLDTDEKQAMVEALARAGRWPDDVRDTVKALGVKTLPVVEAATGSVPTEAEVQAAWEAGQVSAYDKRSLQLSVNRRSNGKTAVSVRLRYVGLTAGGAEVEGQVETLAVADTSQPQANDRDQALIDAVTAAVEAYIAGGA